MNWYQSFSPEGNIEFHYASTWVSDATLVIAFWGVQQWVYYVL